MTRAVEAFEAFEHQDEFFELINRQAVVHAEKRMGNGVNNPVFIQVAVQVVNIRAERIQITKTFFCNPPDEAVDFATVFREVGRQFR